MKRILFVIFISIIITGCNSNHRVNISKQEYLSNHPNILLTELYFPTQINMKSEAKEHIKNKVKTLFERHNVKVFDSSIYVKEYENQKKKLGGLYDSETGKFNKEKALIAENNTLRVLKETHNISSVLFYDVRVKSAPINNFNAEWDGQKETYELNNNDLVNLLSTFFVSTHGRIGALSLTVFLHNMDNSEMYYGAGGIQLVQKINDKDEFVSVPIETLLQDKDKLTKSVNEAFSKLFKTKS